MGLCLAALGSAEAQRNTGIGFGEKGDPAPDTAVAERLVQRGRYEEAITQAKSALARDEHHVPAMVVLAKAYFHLKKYELASSILEIAKAVDAQNGEIYNLQGFLALTHDDHLAATAAFKKATEVNDRYATAWNNLAAQYLYAKNYDAALPAAERAASLAAGSAKAQLNLGSALRGKQRFADAVEAYKKALQIDPYYADAQFDLGILYLDAKEMPGLNFTAKMNVAINYLNRYKQLAGVALNKDDPADRYIAEAKTAIEREIKRQERERKQDQRNQPKPKTGGNN